MNSILRFFLSVVTMCFVVTACKADWKQLLNYPGGAYVKRLASNGNLFFACTDGKGVFVSSNEGNTWTAVNTGISDLHIQSVISHKGAVYAVGADCYASIDNGASWTSMKVRGDRRINQLFSNKNSLFAFCTTPVGAYYRSNDNGATWDSLAIGIQAYGSFLCSDDKLLYIAPKMGSTILSVTSNDNGSTWTMHESGSTPSYGATWVVQGKRMLVGGDQNGVVKSDDDGNTWSESNTGLTTGVVATMLSVGSTVFAGDYNVALYRSTNSGDSWTDVSEGFGSSRAFSQIMQHNGKLYVLLLSGDILHRSMNEVIVGVDDPALNDVASSQIGVFPNPASDDQTIRYQVTRPGIVQIDVLDLYGCVVQNITNACFSVGQYTSTWNTKQVAAGLYSVRVKMNNGLGETYIKTCASIVAPR